MMRCISFLGLSVAAVYLLNSVSIADEHPKGAEHPSEHPTEKPAASPAPAVEEAPKAQESAKPAKKGKKAPKPKKEKASEPTSWNKQQVEKDLVSFINDEKTKTSGMFLVKDEVANQNRQLTLEKIHTDKIVKLSDGTSFVCADFVDASGEVLDVDFFMTPSKEGSVKQVTKVQVHKVNGTPRYTYVEKDGASIQQAVN